VTRAEALELLRARLHSAGVHPADQEAEWLLAHVMKTSPSSSPSSMWRDRDRELDPEQETYLEQVTRRREAREPLQLILGDVPFAGVTLEVASGVFIPRPETEELVEAVLDALTQDTEAGARGARGGPREFRSERTPPANTSLTNERGLSERAPLALRRPPRALRVCFTGAGNGIRTRDPQLGRLTLYQLSYSRP
jgi:hypothetical protein